MLTPKETKTIEAFWAGDKCEYRTEHSKEGSPSWVSVTTDDLYVYYTLRGLLLARRRNKRLWFNCPPAQYGLTPHTAYYERIASRVGVRVWYHQGSWYTCEQVSLAKPRPSVPVAELFVGRRSDAEKVKWELVYPGTVYDQLVAVKDEQQEREDNND